MQGFFLGYFEDGVYEENNFKVLVHYLKSWFAVDCIVVVPDWIMKLLDDDGAGTWGELGKILKGARAIRVMRLLRLAKLQRIVLMVFDQIQSEYTFIVVNLLKMLLCVLVLNHLIACAWYGLARAVDLSGGRNWISVAGIMDESLPYRYLTALHWSLTQFTPAGMDISARNELERLFFNCGPFLRHDCLFFHCCQHYGIHDQSAQHEGGPTKAVLGSAPLFETARYPEGVV